MSEIKTKISTYNDVVDLFGEEKAADMLSEALDWSTIDPKNDKKNIMERKPLLLDPYMTYEGEDYCKHIVAGFLGDRDLDWASGYIDEEKIKNGQVMPADLKSALSMALDNELSTSWAYLDALSSQCAEIFNKFAGYIESAGLARGVLVPGEYELDSNALNADVSERFNIQYGFQCDQMIDAMQFDMTLILTEKVDSMDGYRLIQSVCDWREENLEVIEDAENNLDYGKVPSYVAYERPADIGTTIIDELCASQGTAVEKLVNYPTTKFERTMRDELFEALAVNETTISLMAKVPSSVFLDAVACMDSRYMSGHTVDTGHAFIVSPGTYEPYIGIHDPVYGAGYMIFKKPESESGAAIIEFALGVPFLLIFAMAAMEFGQISAATTAVDNAAHAAARELAVNPSGDASSAKEAAVNAASSFFAENMKIETDVSDAEREAYTHRIPDSNGSSYTDRESNVSTRKCTATVSVTIQPQTVLGDAIYAAGGFGGGMTIESNAVELKDATVEGGASSW